MMLENILEFGVAIPDADYIVRPGGYVVMKNSCDQIGVVLTPQGVFLPGGGQDGQELAADAAVRETFEECGLRVKIVEELAIADELVFSAQEKTYYRKRCSFFTAQLVAVGHGSESDHQLVWMSAEGAVARLQHKSQAWAVMKASS